MDSWLPSLYALRAFEALSRHLSYTAAARELNVTPAAVKQLVRKLETTLGTPLVERRGRGLALTPHGQAGCDDLTAAMTALASATRKMRIQRRDQRLILTVESSFASAWLAPKLSGFRTRHPTISVLIESSPDIVDLTRSDADIAIRYGVPADPALVSDRIFNDRVFPVCAPALADRLADGQSLDDLKSVPLIHFDLTLQPWAVTTQKWFLWRNWLDHFGAAHVATDTGLHFSDYGQSVQAAVAGQGVVLASGPILNAQLAAGVLVAPFSEHVVLDVGYDVVTTPEAAARPEVAAFRSWILEEAAGVTP